MDWLAVPDRNRMSGFQCCLFWCFISIWNNEINFITYLADIFHVTAAAACYTSHLKNEDSITQSNNCSVEPTKKPLKWPVGSFLNPTQIAYKNVSYRLAGFWRLLLTTQYQIAFNLFRNCRLWVSLCRGLWRRSEATIKCIRLRNV